MSAPSVVRAANLSLIIESHVILRDISLDIPKGLAVALLGANGAGKTMLLRVLSTLLRPSEGGLEWFGVRTATGVREIRSRIGILAHQSMLYRDLSARENLEFFGRLYDVPAVAARAERMLELVGLLDRADDAVKTLSRGMTQRVAIGRALMHDPDLLLADEPFDGLDAASTAALEALLGRLRSEGKTTILSNHDVPQTMNIVDRVVVLRKGQLVLDKPVGDLTAAAVLEEILRP